LNAAPLLIPLYEASPEMLEGRSEDEYIAKARALREDQELVSRLMSAAQATEHLYPNSPHLEEQIYSGDFPADAEVALRRQFHEVDWALRRDLAGKFADARHRSLAMRLLYFERPDLLSEEQCARMTGAIERRRRGEAEEQPNCMTVHDALEELHSLLEQSLSDDERLRLTSFRDYLNSL
jgi:exodeoxyribonuclease-1